MNIDRLATFALAMVFVSPVFADELGSSQQLEGFNLNGYTNSGKKSWEINGDKADITDESIKVTNVNANVYDPKQNANLKSKSGVINKTSGDVSLQDDVVITSERGTTVKTDSLQWSRNQDLVKTDDVVNIEDEKGTLSGKGLVGHPNLKRAKIVEDVTLTLKPDAASKAAGSLVQIICDGPMEVDQGKMMAVFNKNVIAKELKTGRELKADKMTVWFDDKKKRLKKVVCAGNVVATQGNNATYADEMVYTADDQRLVMSGRPKLVFDTEGEDSSQFFDQIGK